MFQSKMLTVGYIYPEITARCTVIVRVNSTWRITVNNINKPDKRVGNDHFEETVLNLDLLS